MLLLIFVALLDGSTINLKVDNNFKFDLNTVYGSLKLPIKDIHNINFGVHVENEEPYVQAVVNLGNPIHKQRDAGMLFLKNNPRSAWKFLSKIQDSEDLEVKKRVKQLIESYQDIPNLFDTITISKNVISGHIQQKEIEGVSDSLGSLKIKVSQIRKIDVISSTKSVFVNEEWAIVAYVYNGRLTITASGLIDLYPQTPGQFLSGPKGSINVGKESSYMAGSLIGRGSDGKIFLIGDNFSSTSFPTGKLEIKVVSSIWNTPILGTYEVKIE